MYRKWETPLVVLSGRIIGLLDSLQKVPLLPPCWQTSARVINLWFKIEQVVGTDYEWQLIEKRRAGFKNVDAADLRVQ